MTFKGKTAALWLVGKSRMFSLTSWQQWQAHKELMKQLKCYDEFICSSFYERNQYGGLEIICAGNYY
jgi:hypothetical protein